MSELFDSVFKLIVGEEGGFSQVAADPGNWTTGVVGHGTLKGTKFGIAASSHPTVDIVNLTLDQAKAIYAAEYWDKIKGDQLPKGVALFVFDAAVNNGVSRAIFWLQTACNVGTDGVLGPVTIAKANELGEDLGIEFLARRIDFMASLGTWSSFGLGWSRRLVRLPFLAMQL